MVISIAGMVSHRRQTLRIPAPAVTNSTLQISAVYGLGTDILETVPGSKMPFMSHCKQSAWSQSAGGTPLSRDRLTLSRHRHSVT